MRALLGIAVCLLLIGCGIDDAEHTQGDIIRDNITLNVNCEDNKEENKND